MISGLPALRERMDRARRFSSETGWLPPALFVSVIITQGTLRHAPQQLHERGEVDVALKGYVPEKSAASAQGRSSASAPVASMLPRVVSKWVFEGSAPGAAQDRKEDRRGAALWVGITWRKGIRSWTAARNL